jgi:hypothetical protein
MIVTERRTSLCDALDLSAYCAPGNNKVEVRFHGPERGAALLAEVAEGHSAPPSTFFTGAGLGGRWPLRRPAGRLARRVHGRALGHPAAFPWWDRLAHAG